MNKQECAFISEDGFCSILAIKIPRAELCDKCYARHIKSFEKLHIEDTDEIPEEEAE